MCYFEGAKLVKVHQVPKSRPIVAYKGFDKARLWRHGYDTSIPYESPYRSSTRWRRGEPNVADEQPDAESEGGFYAVKRRYPPHNDAVGEGEHVLRVLLWGRVLEYAARPTYNVAGYRAEFCMIPKRGQKRAA